MCGRYVLRREDLEAALRRLGAAPPPAFASRYNVAPTSLMPVVRRTADGRSRVAELRWGLVPAWSRDPGGGARLANARAEGIAEKPSFREPFRRRRALVPASGFYEWETRAGRKLPWYFQRRDGDPLALAAIWDAWPDPGGGLLETFALITTTPCAEVARIHDRMPVAVEPADASAWLDPERPAADLRALLRPLPDGMLSARAVSPRMNSVRQEGPACLEPPAPGEGAAPPPGGDQLGLW